MKKQRYTAEFKQDAVKMIITEGVAVKEASQHLGVSEGVLYSWSQKVSVRRSPSRRSLILFPVLWLQCASRFQLNQHFFRSGELHLKLGDGRRLAFAVAE